MNSFFKNLVHFISVTDNVDVFEIRKKITTLKISATRLMTFISETILIATPYSNVKTPSDLSEFCLKYNTIDPVYGREFLIAFIINSFIVFKSGAVFGNQDVILNFIKKNMDLTNKTDALITGMVKSNQDGLTKHRLKIESIVKGDFITSQKPVLLQVEGEINKLITQYNNDNQFRMIQPFHGFKVLIKILSLDSLNKTKALKVIHTENILDKIKDVQQTTCELTGNKQLKADQINTLIFNETHPALKWILKEVYNGNHSFNTVDLSVGKVAQLFFSNFIQPYYKQLHPVKKSWDCYIDAPTPIPTVDVLDLFHKSQTDIDYSEFSFSSAIPLAGGHSRCMDLFIKILSKSITQQSLHQFDETYNFFMSCGLQLFGCSYTNELFLKSSRFRIIFSNVLENISNSQISATRRMSVTQFKITNKKFDRKLCSLRTNLLKELPQYQRYVLTQFGTVYDFNFKVSRSARLAKGFSYDRGQDMDDDKPKKKKRKMGTEKSAYLNSVFGLI